MKVLLIVSFFLSISFTAKSSFWYKDIEFLAMENIEVVRGNGKIAIKFDYVINNPNWYGMVIKPSQLQLNVAGNDCGIVHIPQKIKIKRKKKARYPFVLIGDASKFTKSGFSSFWKMLSKGEVDFQLKGKLKAGVFGITKKWDLDYIYKMTWAEFMSFF